MSQRPVRSTQTDEYLEAVADLVAAGHSVSASLAAIRRIGGRAGDWATRSAGSAGRSDGPLAGIAAESRLTAGERELLMSSPVTRLPSLLRWMALRFREERALRAALSAALLAPLMLTVLTVLALPLPDFVVGGRYLVPVLRELSLMVLVPCALVLLVIALARNPRTAPRVAPLLGYVPVVGPLLTLGAEARLAGALAALCEDHRIPGEMLSVAARVVPPGPTAAALLKAAALPEISSTNSFGLDGAVSESLSLTLLAGAESGRLPQRLARFREDAAGSFRVKAAATARGAAWVLLVLVSLRAGSVLVSHPLPGLGGNLNLTGDEQKQLEKLLDGIGQ